MKCRHLFTTALAAAALAGCDAGGGPAGPNETEVPGGAIPHGTFVLSGLWLSAGELHPLPVPIYEETAPTRCAAGDRPHFYLHRGRMEIQGASYTFTMRVSENCWDWDRLVYYSPQPAFRDIVHQGRVSMVTVPHDPEAGGDGPNDPPDPRPVRYLAFDDGTSGPRLYQGSAEGDSLNFAAMHRGGDAFLAIRQ
jgi:hypothetical protein